MSLAFWSCLCRDITSCFKASFSCCVTRRSDLIRDICRFTFWRVSSKFWTYVRRTNDKSSWSHLEHLHVWMNKDKELQSPFCFYLLYPALFSCSGQTRILCIFTGCYIIFKRIMKYTLSKVLLVQSSGILPTDILQNQAVPAGMKIDNFTEFCRNYILDCCVVLQRTSQFKIKPYLCRTLLHANISFIFQFFKI